VGRAGIPLVLVGCVFYVVDGLCGRFWPLYHVLQRLSFTSMQSFTNFLVCKLYFELRYLINGCILFPRTRNVCADQQGNFLYSILEMRTSRSNSRLYSVKASMCDTRLANLP